LPQDITRDNISITARGETTVGKTTAGSKTDPAKVEAIALMVRLAQGQEGAFKTLAQHVDTCATCKPGEMPAVLNSMRLELRRIYQGCVLLEAAAGTATGATILRERYDALVAA